ncbi:MAG TPA: MarR family transcriptional regulator [Gaiellaceae bacterium]|jgi:DNA-binding MarR family transcriptional regulator|nr:MarR family transcriptional regulator [Gaiellaceae bacterium]
MTELRFGTVLLDLATTGTVARTLLQEYLGGSEAGEDYLLFTLLALGGESSPTSLAQRMGVPLTTVSDRLNRLVERGYAERIKNPLDGRSALFRLTDEGWKTYRAVQPQFAELLTNVTGRLEVPVDDVRRGLQALEDALRAELAEVNEKKTPTP